MVFQLFILLPKMILLYGLVCFISPFQLVISLEIYFLWINHHMFYLHLAIFPLTNILEEITFLLQRNFQEQIYC